MGKDKENEIVGVTGVENTEGVTVPGVTVQTADPITYGAGIENLGYDDWAAINVKDTTADYKNAQAALDLNYRTEMATYGENAERMYQMGLSGSGVSDIYGANAYSAYLAASNDLKLRQIEEQKTNRQSWEKYRRDQEDKRRLQHATAFSTFAGQYSEEANGVNNENALRASMAAQGMSKAEVDAVMNDIESYWAGNASVRDANHKAVIDAGYATAYGLFDGYNAEEVKQALIANEFSEADADEVMQKFYETDENGNPKLKDTSALPMVKAKNELIEAGKAAAIAALKAGASVEDVQLKLASDASLAPYANEIMASLNGTAGDSTGGTLGDGNTEDNILEKIEEDNKNKAITDAAKSVNATFAESGSIYSGTEADKESIRQMLAGEDTDLIDGVIEQLEGQLTGRKTAKYKDILSAISTDATSINDMLSVFDGLSGDYDKDSEEYKQISSQISTKMKDSFGHMLGDIDILGSAETAERLNITAEEWAKMDIGKKEEAVMNKAAELAANGEMLQEDFAEFVSEKWLGAELDYIVEKDENGVRAFGLRDSGGVVSQLLDWKDSGALTEEAYNQMLGETVKEIGFKIGNYNYKKNSYEITWGKDGEDANIKFDPLFVFEGDKEIMDKLNEAEPNPKAGTIVMIDNDLYIYEPKSHGAGNRWGKIDAAGITTTEDGVFNTKADREGIYEILKYMLSPERKYVTPGGEGRFKQIETSRPTLDIGNVSKQNQEGKKGGSIVNKNETQLNRYNANARK